MVTGKKDSEMGGRGSAKEEGRLIGTIELEGATGIPEELNLTVYLFGGRGQLLGMEQVAPKGEYSFTFKYISGAEANLVIAPKADLDTVQKSAVFRRSLTAEELKSAVQGSLEKNWYIARAIWSPWLPITVCVGGRVRKLTDAGACPVPFVKVEIFDVDREACWWPPIVNWWENLIDKVVIHAVDLLREPPFPPVGPGPVERIQDLATPVELNPQPLPPRISARLSSQAVLPGEMQMLNPQPLPPGPEFSASFQSTELASEFRSLPAAVTDRLQDLTISSLVAPWFIFPGCFYSKSLVCETTTDCDGFFECCFTWNPWHFRRGRFRFDPLPDIIVKVTQVIGGVEKVIYLDPYTSTRWNVWSTFLNLYVDDPDVECGSGCQPQPAGNDVFFTLVGLDEVYKIDQITGKFSNLAYGGSLANWAYGDWLLFCGLFGQGLSNGAFYYRLSYRKGTNPFKPIKYPLSDTRVDKVTLNSDVYGLGPMTVNGIPNLYQIRNTVNYYWYNPDKIGWWNTLADEPDSGLYNLRLEVFDSSGNLLTSTTVNYLNGTTPPPGPLPPMMDHCDLFLLVDNRYPDLSLNVVGASGECGVVPCGNRASLAVQFVVNQPHGRVWSWSLHYVKGLNAASGYLGWATDNQGISPLPVNMNLTGPQVAPLLSSNETCAYALTLGAWPLVRNGFGAIHHTNLTQAVAIEGC